MKKTLKIFGLLSLLFVAFAFTSCSKDDDPTDNDLFVGTYEGSIGYTNGDNSISEDNGKVTVVKVGDNYTFDFSNDIPSIKDVEMEKNKNVLVMIGSTEAAYIRIDKDVLKIAYTKEGATWTANTKR